ATKKAVPVRVWKASWRGPVARRGGGAVRRQRSDLVLRHEQVSGLPKPTRLAAAKQPGSVCSMVVQIMVWPLMAMVRRNLFCADNRPGVLKAAILSCIILRAFVYHGLASIGVFCAESNAGDRVYSRRVGRCQRAQLSPRSVKASTKAAPSKART